MNERSYVRKTMRLVRELVALFFIAEPGTFFRYLSAIVTSLPAIFRVRNLGPAYAKMEGRDYVLHPLGVSLVLNGKYFGRVTELYARGVYFLPPEFMLRKGMTVVDLGANLGVFTLLAALVGRRVVAVEAIQGFIDDMRENLQRNKCFDKVDVVYGMVGFSTGLFTNEQLLHDASGSATPPNLLMNDVFRSRGLKTVDFMKIDIEGSEFDLFAHDIEWLPRVARIAMGVHPQYGDILELARNIERAGFSVQLVNLDRKAVSEISGEAGYLFAKNLEFEKNGEV